MFHKTSLALLPLTIVDPELEVSQLRGEAVDGLEELPTALLSVAGLEEGPVFVVGGEGDVDDERVDGLVRGGGLGMTFLDQEHLGARSATRCDRGLCNQYEKYLVLSVIFPGGGGGVTPLNL